MRSFARVLHRGVEGNFRRREVRAPNERERIRCSPVAIHSRVLPLDGERSGVPDSVQGAEEGLEVDVAVPGRDEVPASLRLAEVEMTAEDALAPVERLPRVLHVDVIDAVRKLLDERGRVEELVGEVARVEVDPELRPSADRVERLARRDEVVGDLGGVHLETEPDPLLLEDVHDRTPPLGEIVVSTLDLLEVVRGKRVEEVP